MRKLPYILFIVTMVQLVSCLKDDGLKESPGKETIVQGKVYDPIRNIHIKNYKVRLDKSISNCADWVCTREDFPVGSDISDSNGNFFIKFNYKLKPGEIYWLRDENYIPFYHVEYTTPHNLLPGIINNIDIHAWEPVRLKLNVQVINNIHPPLLVTVEYDNNQTLNAPESFYDVISNKTYTLNCKPDYLHEIVFRYYTGSQASPVRHEKKIPYQTSFQDTTQTGVSVDCSTF